MSQFEQLIEPDSVNWHSLLKHLAEQGFKPDQDFTLSLQKMAMGSNYAINQLNKCPKLVQNLKNCHHFELKSEKLIGSLKHLNDLNSIKQTLRNFRHQKLLEIIYLDICKQEKIEDTLLQLSQLADLIIQQTLNKCEKILSIKHGQPVDTLGHPMHLNIIGMGKLGGKELNFSSDIDLICCYREDGKLNGIGKLTHAQYFTHVVKMFKQCLHETTSDGFVYRVDLRLRPWGEAGPLVLSHNALEHYYQLHGREWEQYAMVKARVISGSDHDKEQLRSILKPFVYRRYHDYRVFEGLSQLKLKIDQQAKHKEARNNIKIGRGGIREIEFFVQAFQILKGGRNHHLQTQSLFEAMDAISQQQITDPESIDKMRASYCFLRLLENRLQMFNDLQTHETPQIQNSQHRLSRLAGYSEWAALEQDLKFHQNQVHEIFSSLFNQQPNTQQKATLVQNFDEMNEEQHIKALQNIGFNDPQKVHQQLRQFYHSRSLIFMSKKAKKRFQSFFPELLKQVSLHQQQPQLLKKLLALLSSIAGRSLYFELLYLNIPLLARLVHQFDSSNWIATEVTHHPILLETILFPAKLSERFNKKILQQSLQIQLQNISTDEELELDVLRQFKRAQTITIASAEIAQEIDTIQVSLYLSDLAEVLMQAVYHLSLSSLVKKHGEPYCVVNGKTMIPSLAIIAYGKLGGNELHYKSDLDIIFLHNSSGTSQHTTGGSPIHNSVFFSRLGQKIVSKTSLLTAAGRFYEIDTRLRPNGASGLLVSSLLAYHEYQQEKAWNWEHQALIRARFIAGNMDIKPAFDNIRRKVISLPRQQNGLKKSITNMRHKMYQISKPPEGKQVNIKHSKGCMIDIEFLVQYWVLKHANKFASLIERTDNVGLISELHHLGLITDEDRQLQDCYPIFHQWLHARVLQNQSAEISTDQVRNEIDIVRDCWERTFNTY